MELMRALTNSRRFDKLPKLAEERGGDMFTEFLDEIEEKGIENGINNANLRVAEDMLRGEEPLVKIVLYSRLDEDRIRKLAGTLGGFGQRTGRVKKRRIR